ncbi:hypothetical protein [Streptomyces sp. MST-110588]|uniref:hypothetical protein n=1 Tax=Streptomyces sp. MST-110588 TaxID=2833628 RepID=UPI0032427D19
MTVLHDRSGTTGPQEHPGRPKKDSKDSKGGKGSGRNRAGLAIWARDLVLGMRFAVGSGREGWVRTILTAVGVGLGVALLLGATSVPNLSQARSDRADARGGVVADDSAKPSDSSVLLQRLGTVFRGTDVDGLLLRPEGARPVLPPAWARCPAPVRWWSRPPSKSSWSRRTARCCTTGIRTAWWAPSATRACCAPARPCSTRAAAA